MAIVKSLQHRNCLNLEFLYSLNTAPQLLPEAGAQQTLEAVGGRRWFGAGLAEACSSAPPWFGHTLGNKLKNGGLNYAGWLPLLPDNLLQAFHGFRGK
jgi:hypothetical protein